MEKLIKKIPFIGVRLFKAYRRWIKPFEGSKNYWVRRYEEGRDSGDGSYGKLAEYKAEILNEFIKENNVKTVIEFGCGDGNQLKMINCPAYIGFDISPKVISLCREKFRDDNTKAFSLAGEYKNETAELAISLDVIYHLVEDNVYTEYMNRLFDSAERFVIIFSSNTDENPLDFASHIRNRKFTSWVSKEKTAWRLINYIRNKYPYKDNSKTGSIADFFIYERIAMEK